VVKKAPRKKIRRVASTERSLDTLLLIALIFRRKSQRENPRNQTSTQANSRSRLKRF